MPHVIDNVPTSLGATSPSVSSTRRVWRNHCRLALTVRTTDRPIVPRRPIRWTDGSALGRGGGGRGSSRVWVAVNDRLRRRRWTDTIKLLVQHVRRAVPKPLPSRASQGAGLGCTDHGRGVSKLYTRTGLRSTGRRKRLFFMPLLCAAQLLLVSYRLQSCDQGDHMKKTMQKTLLATLAGCGLALSAGSAMADAVSCSTITTIRAWADAVGGCDIGDKNWDLNNVG